MIQNVPYNLVDSDFLFPMAHTHRQDTINILLLTNRIEIFALLNLKYDFFAIFG